jgi:hypothetical protein
MIFGSMSYSCLIHFSLFIRCFYFDLIYSCLILFDQWRGSKLPVSPNHCRRPTSLSRCQLSVVQLRLSLFQIWCHHRRQNHATVLWEPEDTTENYIRSFVSLNDHNLGDTILNLKTNNYSASQIEVSTTLKYNIDSSQVGNRIFL